jgi:hypothetical protein
MVDPTVDGRTLLERLRDAPWSIVGYASSAIKVMLTHVLGLVKSYHPTMDINLLRMVLLKAAWRRSSPSTVRR